MSGIDSTTLQKYVTMAKAAEGHKTTNAQGEVVHTGDDYQFHEQRGMSSLDRDNKTYTDEISPIGNQSRTYFQPQSFELQSFGTPGYVGSYDKDGNIIANADPKNPLPGQRDLFVDAELHCGGSHLLVRANVQDGNHNPRIWNAVTPYRWYDAGYLPGPGVEIDPNNAHRAKTAQCPDTVHPGLKQAEALESLSSVRKATNPIQEIIGSLKAMASKVTVSDDGKKVSVTTRDGVREVKPFNWMTQAVIESEVAPFWKELQAASEADLANKVTDPVFADRVSLMVGGTGIGIGLNPFAGERLPDVV
jgi:hypothetical protein